MSSTNKDFPVYLVNGVAACVKCTYTTFIEHRPYGEVHVPCKCNNVVMINSVTFYTRKPVSRYWTLERDKDGKLNSHYRKRRERAMSLRYNVKEP